MVQVDVFWSYGIGATLGVAAARQAVAPAKERLADPHLVRALLFLALVFAPSGAYLLWAFPSWETMHVGDRELPAWLVALFAATNVGLGFCGYLVAEALARGGRHTLARLQIVLAYFAMFFILVHGWDGTGYQRFFSATPSDFAAWSGDWQGWLTSDVALTLYGMGVVLVPLLLWLWARGSERPYRLAGELLATIFGAGLGLAVGAHLLVGAV